MDVNEYRQLFDFSGPKGLVRIEADACLANTAGQPAAKAYTLLQLAAGKYGIGKDHWLAANSRRRLISQEGEFALKRIADTVGFAPGFLAQQAVISSRYLPANNAINELFSRVKIAESLLKMISHSLDFRPVLELAPQEAVIFPRKKNYVLAQKCSANLACLLISSLRIFYKVKSAEQAMAVINQVRSNLKVFQGYFSRERLERYQLIAGKGCTIPAAKIRSWEDYFLMMEKLGTANDPNECKWLVRLVPEGAVEFNLCDATADREKMTNIVMAFVGLAEDATS